MVKEKAMNCSEAEIHSSAENNKNTRMNQTEIGLLPEDWEVVKIPDVLSEMTDFVASGSFESLRNNVSVFDTENYALYVRLYDIRLGLGHSSQKYVDAESYSFLKKSNLFGNEILMANIGANVGEVFYMPIIDEKSTIAPNMIVLRANLKKCNSKFLYNFIDSDKGKELLNELISGSGHPKINKTDLKKLQIPLPPLPEQEAIAEALSDCDAWIDGIEQLLAKKRLIKQGAMQELLTPKEDWEAISLIEIAERKRDLFNDGDWIESEHIKSEGIRLIQTGNIGVGKFLNRENRKFINEKSFSDLKCKELLEGDLLICRLAEPAGRACIFPKTSDYKTVTSVDVTIFRPDVKKYSRELIMYILCTDEWFRNVIEQVGGTTHKRISRGNLGLINIQLPKSLTEQTRIARILSDMDAELEALGQKLAKARQIKQGMMQELLTGRVRLV